MAWRAMVASGLVSQPELLQRLLDNNGYYYLQSAPQETVKKAENYKYAIENNLSNALSLGKSLMNDFIKEGEKWIK